MGIFTKKEPKKVDNTYCEIISSESVEELQEKITNVIKQGKVIKDIQMFVSKGKNTALLIYDPWAQKLSNEKKNNSIER